MVLARTFLDISGIYYPYNAFGCVRGQNAQNLVVSRRTRDKLGRQNGYESWRYKTCSVLLYFIRIRLFEDKTAV